MARQNEEQKQGTTEAIMEAALRVFGEHGYDGASLKDVADRAGVTKPTLYNYYKDKAQIYEQMLLFVHHRYMNGAREAIASEETVPKKIEALLEFQFEFARHYVAVSRAIHSTMFLPDDVKPKINPLLTMEEKFGLVHELVRQGIQQELFEGEAMDIALTLSGLSTLGMIQASLPNVPILQPGLAARLWSVVYRGIERRQDHV
ncbi:MAG: TetR/AcrR family transcriptional regulator [Deltaproteobacteria bacterium]|nr:TetR/AcrR family transcriptional regulator [Deltaproteobacteria bacterium]